MSPTKQQYHPTRPSAIWVPTLTELPRINAIQRLRRIARPVIFRTGLPETPVSIAGSAFVVGLGPSLYVLTAAHVVADYPAHQLLVLPCEGATDVFHISHSWKVEHPFADQDATDLLIMRVTMDRLKRRIREQARVLDLRTEVGHWFEDRFSSTFFLFGFPKQFNSIDYDREEIDLSLAFLQANYVGPSHADECHEIKCYNPLGIESFDGARFSGSPVFAMRNDIGRTAPTRFCGMAIRGGAASGRIHFLGVEVIRAALEEAGDRQ